MKKLRKFWRQFWDIKAGWNRAWPVILAGIFAMLMLFLVCLAREFFDAILP